jgi:outer membrane biosynthesis protein TonB
MVARAKPKRMYRTMQGRMVDIEKLRSANESEVIKKYYEQPKGKVSEGPASTKQKPAQQPQVEIKAVEPKKVATPNVATPKVAPKRTVAPKKGIDAALDGLE